MTASSATIWAAELDDVPVAMTAAAGVLAVAGAEGTCVIVDSGSGTSQSLVTVDDSLLHCALSSDGDHLALCGTTGYRLWRTGDAGPAQFEAGGWSSHACWTSDGRVAFAAGRRVAVHLADGSLLWRSGPAPSTVTDLTWFRQGREIAAAAYAGVHRFARHRQDPVGHFAYPGSHLAVAATNNGRWICTGNQDRSVHIWRTRDGGELEMAGYPDKVTRLSFDDTGRWLANDGSPDVTVWDFSGKGPGGRKPLTLRAHERVGALAWRPGPGGVLASGGDEGTLAIWSVGTGTPGIPVRPLRRVDLDTQVNALTWLDQRRLVVALGSGGFRAVDTGRLG